MIIIIVAIEKSKDEIRSPNNLSLSQSIRFATAQGSVSVSQAQAEIHSNHNYEERSQWNGGEGVEIIDTVGEK
jgi:hypothetical protein